jgi:hypothetical protein
MAGLSADCLFGLGACFGVGSCGVWSGLGGAVLGAWREGLAGLWCPRALVSGPRFLLSVRGAWLVVRAVRWSVVVWPLWFMFAHFRKCSRDTQFFLSLAGLFSIATWTNLSREQSALVQKIGLMPGSPALTPRPSAHNFLSIF